MDRWYQTGLLLRPFLLCRLELHSIDASPQFYEEGIFNASVFQLLLSDGITTVIPESIYTTSTPFANDIYGFELNAGDTVELLLGFPLPQGSSSDGLYLIFITPRTRFTLGL